MDPITLSLLIAGVSGAAKIGSSLFAASKEKKLAKKKSKEMKRSTYADILNSALQKGADIESHSLESSAKKSRRRTRSLMNTAAGVRESVNI